MRLPPALALAWLSACPVGKAQDPEGTVVCELFLLKDVTSETSQWDLKLAFGFPHGS